MESNRNIDGVTERCVVTLEQVMRSAVVQDVVEMTRLLSVIGAA